MPNFDLLPQQILYVREQGLRGLTFMVSPIYWQDREQVYFHNTYPWSSFMNWAGPRNMWKRWWKI